MIGYFPSIYEDETLYSFFARYYSHMGYPSYVNALEDLLKKRTSKIDMEFWGDLNEEATNALSSMYDIEELLLNHTMFPQYARFTTPMEQEVALASLVSHEGDIHRMLPFPTSKSERHLMYCPMCAKEDRERYGETYWHRAHLIRNIGVCAKHGCCLKETPISMSAKGSPRLYVGEDEIPDDEPIEYKSDRALDFARYILNVFQMPMKKDDDVPIHEFLKSKLEGTRYLSTRGGRREIGLLHQDYLVFYKGNPSLENYELHKIQKIFLGNNRNFYDICAIAYFLGIHEGELINRNLPPFSQSKVFDKTILSLYEQGLGCHRIARMVGVSPSTVSKTKYPKAKAPRDYSVRKGIPNEDWSFLDKEMLPLVKKRAKEIYEGGGDRPHRVTRFAIERAFEWPSKRLDYLPKCKNALKKYEETFEEYWAREVTWAYRKIKKDKEIICWRDIRNITNLRTNNFKACFSYLHRYASMDEVNAITNLI